MARAPADRAALFVEFDHLDHILARHAAIVNRDGVDAGVRVDELETQGRLRVGDPGAPVWPNGLLVLALQTRSNVTALRNLCAPSVAAGARGDEPRGAREPSELVAVSDHDVTVEDEPRDPT